MTRIRMLFGLLLALLGAGTITTAAGAQAPPAIRHVWVIVLENKSYDQAFVNNTNPYLWKQLPASGVLLRQYHGTGHFSLDNYLSLIAGQAPNIVTQLDCPIMMDVIPGTPIGSGQVTGQGCVYPSSVKTLADQLEDHGLTWKGYMQDLGNDPAREPARCGNPPIGKADATQSATATDQYAARHNPFVYFHSVLDPPGRCAAHIGPLPPLVDDLQTEATTPNFSFITPNLCDDGHDATPCAGVNSKGTKEGGLIAADAFLAKWVPLILASPAFKKDGMVVVTLDESGDGTADACCNEPAGFNTPFPGQTGPGGGRIGTVILSPFATPGSVSDVPYNHYSMLRSLEDLFGLGEHLGYAGMDGLVPLGSDVYSRPEGGTVPILGALASDDMGSTGKATPLRLRVGVTLSTRRARLQARLRRPGGIAVRVRLTGTDRLSVPLRARLYRVRAKRTFVVADSGRPRLLKHAAGTLRLRLRAGARIVPGRYRLIVAGLHELKALVSVKRSLTVTGTARVR